MSDVVQDVVTRHCNMPPQAKSTATYGGGHGVAESVVSQVLDVNEVKRNQLYSSAESILESALLGMYWHRQDHQVVAKTNGDAEIVEDIEKRLLDARRHAVMRDREM